MKGEGKPTVFHALVDCPPITGSSTVSMPCAIPELSKSASTMVVPFSVALVSAPDTHMVRRVKREDFILFFHMCVFRATREGASASPRFCLLWLSLLRAYELAIACSLARLLACSRT